MLGPEIARTGQQLLSAITKDDQVAVWKYTDKIEKVSDFTRDKDRLESIFYSLRETAFSETNLYDAVIFAVGLMRPVPGRKAVLLVSSGVDTFSKASLEDAQRTVEQGDTPIYVISMVPLARQFTEMSAAPASRIDWNKAELGLEKIAEVSGGRAYAPEGPTDLSGAYDDIMENLKIRYVVRYHSSSTRDPNQPRTVKIDLVDPDTGKPLTIVNSSGRNVRAHLVVQDRYIPTVAAQH
jgi:VWFA-related protein